MSILPLFLSSFLFLSVVFALFAPLPVLVAGLQTRRPWLPWLAALTNFLLIHTLAGPAVASVFLVYALTPALALPYLARYFSLENLPTPTGGVRPRRVEKVLLLTLAAMAAVFALLVIGSGIRSGLTPWAEVQRLATEFTTLMDQSLSEEARRQLVGEASDPEAWKSALLLELPSAFALLALAVVFCNWITVLRLNPFHLRESLGADDLLFRSWKAPEWLIWPSLLSAAPLLSDFGVASVVALNFFKLFMAVYAIQGLSILSFFFDVWNIRGTFRSLGYLLAFFLMLPLVLSLGFFDLWFDFRSKFRQS